MISIGVVFSGINLFFEEIENSVVCFFLFLFILSVWRWSRERDSRMRGIVRTE